jgi:hypothetical protein
MSTNWTAPTSWDAVCRRAAGRRRYNAARKELRNARRAEIICRAKGMSWWRLYGIQAALARELGVSRATISRDFRAFRNADKGALLK